MIPLAVTEIALDGHHLVTRPVGRLLDVLRRHLAGEGVGGLVVLGAFGSGKTTAVAQIAEESDGLPRTVVPLRAVARAANMEKGLTEVVGASRLAEARAGVRVLLLDGLDEVPNPGGRGAVQFFHELLGRVGPRFVVTSRPGWFRTDEEVVPDQVDSLDLPGVRTLLIEPLPIDIVLASLGALPGGAYLGKSVENLVQLATSPMLLQVVHAALPFIEPNRPIHPWGVFDAWIRSALKTGPGHDDAVERLEDLAWSAFARSGFSLEVPQLETEHVSGAHLPGELRRSLLVTELDGGHRFGHRSVYEFLLASHLSPKLAANQDQPPDALTGLALTDAMRAMLVGRRGTDMPLEWDHERRRVRIPAGNFVSGGDRSPDERPLVIAHLARPVWIAREPVTHGNWASYLSARPDDRIDANYLRHWGVPRKVPKGFAEVPIYNIWPEDADAYAQWAKGRLPSADEWEKAVRGIDGRLWPWGDFFRPGMAVTSETHVERPLPVHAFGAQGEAQLFSAVGGVFEYTADAWRGRPDRGRIVMGGCFTHPGSVSRASLRLSHRLSGNLKAGLRLAWDAA